MKIKRIHTTKDWFETIMEYGGHTLVLIIHSKGVTASVDFVGINKFSTEGKTEKEAIEALKVKISTAMIKFQMDKFLKKKP